MALPTLAQQRREMAALRQRKKQEQDAAKPALTQDYLKQILHYDPGTGVFTRIDCLHGKLIGKEAGTATANGVRYISVCGKLRMAHVLAVLYMEGKLPSRVCHINGDRSDNRWSNLSVPPKRK